MLEGFHCIMSTKFIRLFITHVCTLCTLTDHSNLALTVMDIERRLKEVERNQIKVLHLLETHHVYQYGGQMFPSRGDYQNHSFPTSSQMMDFHQMPLRMSPFRTPPEASFATQHRLQQSPYYYLLEAPTSRMFPAPPKPPPPTPASTQPTQASTQPTPASTQPTHHSTSNNKPTDEHQIEPLPLSSNSNVTVLPSSAINREKLIPVKEVIAKYYKMKGESKAGALACKIAREAIFGKDMMKKCTSLGNRELPGLLSEEL